MKDWMKDWMKNWINNQVTRLFRSSVFPLPSFRLLVSVWIMWSGGEALAASRGVGPFKVQTRQGTAMIRLLRREGDIIWVERKTKSGTLIEAGLPISDIVSFDIPPAKVFAIVEKVKSKETAVKVCRALRLYAAKLKPYRDLPGIPADKAVFAEGRLNVRLQDWHKALSCFNELIKQEYESELTQQARLYAGICMVELEQYAEGLPLLAVEEMMDDNLVLLSQVYFARGRALEALEQYEQAVLAYLYPVVFYPYVNQNEIRGLAAVLPCYVAMQDWDALYKTHLSLTQEYPGEEETLQADEFFNQFRERMENEKLFQIDNNQDEKKRERIKVL